MSADQVVVPRSERRAFPHLKHLLLLGLVLSGAALRFYHLGKLSYWEDEVTRVLDAYYVPRTFADVIPLGLEHAQPPLLYWLLRSTYYVARFLGFSESDALGRLPEALLGIVTIPLLFLIARRCFGERLAWGAAILLTFSPFAVWYSQDVGPYTLWPLMNLIVFYLLIRAIHLDRWLDWGLTAIGMVLAVYASAFSAVAIGTYIGSLGLLLLVRRLRHRAVDDGLTVTTFLKASGCGLLAGISFLPLLAGFLDISAVYAVKVSAAGAWDGLPVGKYLYTILDSLLPYARHLGIAGSILMAAVVACGVISTVRRGGLAGFMLACSVVGTTFITYVSFFIRRVQFWPRYTTGMLPSYILALAFGGWQVADWLTLRWLPAVRGNVTAMAWVRRGRLALCGAGLLALLFGNVLALRDVYRRATLDIRGFVRSVERLVQSNDLLVFTPEVLGTEWYSYYFSADYAHLPRYQPSGTPVNHVGTLYLPHLTLVWPSVTVNRYAVPEEAKRLAGFVIHRIQVNQDLRLVAFPNSDFREAHMMGDVVQALPGWGLPAGPMLHREEAGSDAPGYTLRLEYSGRDAAEGIVSEPLSVTAGSLMLVVMEGKAQTIGPLGTGIDLEVYDHEGSQIATFMSDPLRGSQDWIVLRAGGILPEQAATIRIAIGAQSALKEAGVFWVRSVRLFSDEGIPRPDGQVDWRAANSELDIPNAGFEMALASVQPAFWQLAGRNAEVALDRNVLRFGGAALRVTTTGAVESYSLASPRIPVTVPLGVRYTFKVWVRTQNLPQGKGAGYLAAVGWFGADGQRLAVHYSQALQGSHDWQLLSITEFVPAGARYVWLNPVRLSNCAEPGAIVWVDGISLTFFS